MEKNPKEESSRKDSSNTREEFQVFNVWQTGQDEWMLQPKSQWQEPSIYNFWGQSNRALHVANSSHATLDFPFLSKLTIGRLFFCLPILFLGCSVYMQKREKTFIFLLQQTLKFKMRETWDRKIKSAAHCKSLIKIVVHETFFLFPNVWTLCTRGKNEWIFIVFSH